MTWRHIVGGGLVLLLAQGVAVTGSPAIGADDPEAVVAPEPSAAAALVPWVPVLEGNPQAPLLGAEYSLIMAALWDELEAGWWERSHRITDACVALGSDMAYLRGRVPRQIEDAHRQMAPFQTKAQTKALSAPWPASTGQVSSALGFGILPMDDTEAETLLELIRAGDPHIYATYEQLLWQFAELELAAYMDPTQDEAPLTRGDFFAYAQTLHRELQDPTGAMGRHEQFLAEADRLMQDLLTMLREVRRSLAMLEATKGLKAAPAGSPNLPARLPLPTVEVGDGAIVTRRDFVLAMLDIVEGFTTMLYRPAQCGGYRVESFVNSAEEMEREIWHLMQALDDLNLEILSLVGDRSR